MKFVQLPRSGAAGRVVLINPEVVFAIEQYNDHPDVSVIHSVDKTITVHGTPAEIAALLSGEPQKDEGTYHPLYLDCSGEVVNTYDRVHVIDIDRRGTVRAFYGLGVISVDLDRPADVGMYGAQSWKGKASHVRRLSPVPKEAPQ